MTTVRICVCGDSGVGKSSLIAGLVKDTFITGRIQAVLPQITIPPIFGMPSVSTGAASGSGGAITVAAGSAGENVTTVVVDTSALPEHRDSLNREIKRSNVILLVYADHYSYERLGLFWLPHFRSLGVNVPVILCAAKSDAPDVTVAAAVASGGGGGHHSHPAPDPVRAFEEETLSLMTEFKEVDSCLRASAKAKHNVREAFFLCQKAVTHPVAPLYDSKEQALKQAAATALRRVFWLADHDKDGLLSDLELQAFQARCFGKPLEPADLVSIKQIIEAASPGSVTEAGIDQRGFLALNKYFIDKGRHETVWIIVRAHHYSDSLSLREAFIHPKFDVPAYSSAELSPTGYQFFFDLFLRFDQDKDGGLNDAELAALFAPTPGLPQSWTDTGASAFPSSTVRNEAGHITLQGWLAQWSMTTFSSPRTTLEYLAYLGFEPPDARSTNAAALKVTKPRKRRSRGARVERTVVHAYLVGAPGAGKSSLLDAFLSQPFSPTYRPTLSSRVAVNSVELPGGKQCYLILEELGATLEPAILSNPSRLDACDLLLCTYDSADPDSFTHLTRLLDPNSSSSSNPNPSNAGAKHTKSSGSSTLTPEFPPAMFVALKADLDRAVQRDDAQQPDEFCAARGLQKPHHVSVAWDRKSVSELFVAVAEAALRPADAAAAAAVASRGGAGGGAGGAGKVGKGGSGGAGSVDAAGTGLSDRLGLYIGTGAAVAAVAAGVAVWRKSRQE